MNTNKNIFIVLIILTCIGLAYFYISKSTKSEAANPLSSLVSSNDSSGLNNTDVNDDLAAETAFLSTLVSLKRIKIKTDLFKNDLFATLADNAVTLNKVEPGRANPFASIGLDASIKIPVDPKIDQANKNKVETIDATKVASKTAVLNGSVTSDGNITSSYFEFGDTELLENKTPQVLKTQLGNYSTNLTNLQPKTTYYFRASSVINGSVYSGEVKSFTTN